MGTVVVTGAAGFLGSTLAARLLADGERVLGIDVRSPESDVVAAANLEAVASHPGFELLVADLLDLPLIDVVAGADAVVHLAGQPGVQSSWGLGFASHVDRNVHAAQVVLEAALAARTPRTVLASSSSVYGNVARGRAAETTLPAPTSPMG